jgi:hypothetical protein
MPPPAPELALAMPLALAPAISLFEDPPHAPAKIAIAIAPPHATMSFDAIRLLSIGRAALVDVT